MTRVLVHAVGLAALLLALGAPAQQAPAPEALVRDTVNEVLDVIRRTKDPRALVELAEQKVLPHFDFTIMTRLAVGRSWSQASAAQQQALERAFRTLLVRTYTTALAQASGEYTVEVKASGLKPGETDTVVRTQVREPGRKPIQMDYRMRLTASGWKVYDVVVENLSLVTNYRSSFASEIARSGIEGLIRAIESKNRKESAS
ncbi:MAG TPA: ABC transporter substrate-binding protein [Burkholderiales bacterium]|nr:ABC transporter substrate-binding protein [Burkholderiales bacterium]